MYIDKKDANSLCCCLFTCYVLVKKWIMYNYWTILYIFLTLSHVNEFLCFLRNTCSDPATNKIAGSFSIKISLVASV